MFETLFGSEMPLAARFFIAFLVVLALIGLTAWLVRRFGSNRLGGAAARPPAAAGGDRCGHRRRPPPPGADPPRQCRASPDDRRPDRRRGRAQYRARGRRPRRGARAGAGRRAGRDEPAIRQTPNGENSWPLQPSSEPPPIPAPRPSRSAATEEPWLPPEPGARARPADSLTGLAAELSTRLSPPEAAAPRAANRRRGRASRRVAPPQPEPAAPPQTDHNLAEMAQQLEAALRRTPMPESRPPVTDPLAAAGKAGAGARFQAAHRTQIRTRAAKTNSKPSSRPRLSQDRAKSEPKLEPRLEPKLEPAPTKAPFDNLEEEMASLLGRPPGKT